MKRSIIPVLVTLAFGGGAFADDAHHPEKQVQQTQNPQAVTPQKPPAEPAPATKDGAAPGMPMMQEHMKQMQEQMAKIRTEKDPAQREKLLQEHMNTMDEHMKMMRSMMGGGMMGPGTTGGMSPQMMEKRMRMMEQRLDMMQQMMEQMNQNKQQSMPMKK